MLSCVGLDHEAINVRSVVDLGFSLHVTYTSHCVDALIEGNDVAMMLVTIKGHLKVIVYQGESISSYHLTVLVCLSIYYLSTCLSVYLSSSSLFVEDNAPDLVHQQYVSVFAWRGVEWWWWWWGSRVVSLLFTPQQSSNHPSIMHLMKGYHAEPFLKHSGNKQNNLCSPREKWSSC